MTSLASPLPVETSSTPAHATDRRILWLAVLALCTITIVRLSSHLFDTIMAADSMRDLAAELDDPALVTLAVRIGSMLAVIIAAVCQTIYLLLCATMDEKLLPTLMVPTRRRPDSRGRVRGLGPATVIGIASTVPVHLTALLFGLTSPKDSPLTWLWLAVTVLAVTLWSARRHAASAPTPRARVIVAVILVTAAALSLLF